MAKVLIVDDEEVYRNQLEMALALDGHEISTAASGRSAIDVGTRFRPDVLVGDWMLKDHIHGLHVVEVLRAVTPQIRSILITGFPSKDLREDAEKARVTDFIEKPFGRDRIRSAVGEALRADQSPLEGPRPAVLEVDSEGVILFANPTARELLAKTEAGVDAATLAEVFVPRDVPDLDAAADQWVAARPRSEDPTVWHVRSQGPRNGESRLVVLRREHEPQNVGSVIIRMLLGLEDTRSVSCQFEGRVLLIDDEELLRRLFVSVMESAGVGCYGVESPDAALRLLEKDDGIRFVIHDYYIPKVDVAESIKRIRAIRPDVVIVGISGRSRREAFAALGVDRYLDKPWQIDDLIDVLSG